MSSPKDRKPSSAESLVEQDERDTKVQRKAIEVAQRRRGQPDRPLTMDEMLEIGRAGFDD